MICKNCGVTMGDFDTFCPNCGASANAGTQYSQVNYGENSSEPIKTTGLLVFSIIETCCINFITGLIGIVLWAVKLKPAADSGDVVEAKKAKKLIKIVLWIGLILSLLLIIVVPMLIAIPNFSGIQKRMTVRADIATASQIGKAARIWCVDAIMEPEEYNVDEVRNGLVRIDEMRNFDNYVSTSQVPMYKVDGTIENGAYYVTIINEDEPINEKIVVAIGPENLYLASQKDKSFNETFNKNLDGIDSTDITYDGKGSGIAYIEP